MMNFQAVSIGSSVPRDHFDATVQSVFDSSINLRLDHHKELVTVLISDHYDLPQGIRLDVKNVPFQSLTVGLQASCRGGILRFSSSPLTIDLRRARIWDGRLPRTSIDPQKPSTGRAWSIVWQSLNRQQRLKQTDLIARELFQSDTGSLLTRKLGQPIQQLITATKRLEPHTSAEAAAKMLGLGPGVTPSGDDILIGYLAGLWSTTTGHHQQLNFLSNFGNLLSALTEETNEISRTYLHYATKGEFASGILALVSAISDGEELTILSAAKDAMRVGHSSGMDSVTGLLLGIAAWSLNLSLGKEGMDSSLDSRLIF
jgi:hypothetical protein